MKKKFRLGENEKEIIKLIGLGLLITASLAIPNLPLALKPFLDNKSKRIKFKRTIKNLSSKNLIILGGEKIYLTKKGEKILKKIQSDEIKIKKKKWDGSWRVVSYDIPNKFGIERDYFRLKLKNFGFERLQKSLWIIPYECKEEIALLAQNLGISPYVIYLTTKKIPNQQKLTKLFNLNS